MEELYGYAEALSPQIFRAGLLNRPVMLVLGKADTDRGWSLDKACEANMKGENRYERGLLYKHHLSSLVGAARKSQLVWSEIPEVGHEASGVFTHPSFTKEIKALEFFKNKGGNLDKRYEIIAF